jgi:hypothetical protein
MTESLLVLGATNLWLLVEAGWPRYRRGGRQGILLAVLPLLLA